MSISKLLVLLLGLVAVAFAAKYALSGTLGRDPEGSTQPKRQLDNVRERSKELEGEMQKNANDAVKQSDEQR
jgi:hypothetical protein